MSRLPLPKPAARVVGGNNQRDTAFVIWTVYPTPPDGTMLHTADQLHTYADASNAALRAELERLREQMERQKDEWLSWEGKRSDLKQDAERYRWLRSNPEWLGWDSDFRPDEVEREIDAARKATP